MNIHPDTLPFFDDLLVNNNREWFNENKSRWTAIRDQFVDFTQALIDVMTSKAQMLELVEGLRKA